MSLSAPTSHTAVEPGTEHTSGISKDLTMMETDKMQQALAVTLKLMERTLAATGEELVCPQPTQPVTDSGVPVTDSRVVQVDRTVSDLAVKHVPTLVEQNLEHNTTTHELVLVANIGALGDSQEVQVATDDAIEGTQASAFREELVDAQAPTPIELDKDHPVSTAREGTSNPSPTTEGGHSPGTDSSNITVHQEVANLTQESEIHPQPQSIDEFLESISLPIQQPLFQEVPQSPQVVNSNIGRKNQREVELSTQRKSTRLAKKG